MGNRAIALPQRIGPMLASSLLTIRFYAWNCAMITLRQHLSTCMRSHLVLSPSYTPQIFTGSRPTGFWWQPGQFSERLLSGPADYRRILRIPHSQSRPFVYTTFSPDTKDQYSASVFLPKLQVPGKGNHDDFWQVVATIGQSEYGISHRARLAVRRVQVCQWIEISERLVSERISVNWI